MRDKDVSTHEAILEAGFQVLGKNSGATLSDIADAAGVGRATLHRHFKGRDDLIKALAIAADDALRWAVDQATQNCESHCEGLRQAMRAMVPLATRQMFLAGLPDTGDEALAARNAQHTSEMIREIEASKGEGLFARDVPNTWIAEAYVSLLYAAWAQVVAGELTHRQASDWAWRTLTKGLSDDR